MLGNYTSQGEGNPLMYNYFRLLRRNAEAKAAAEKAAAEKAVAEKEAANQAAANKAAAERAVANKAAANKAAANRATRRAERRPRMKFGFSEEVHANNGQQAPLANNSRTRGDGTKAPKPRRQGRRTQTNRRRN